MGRTPPDTSPDAQSAWAVRSTSPHNPLRSHSIGPVDHRVSTRKRTAKNIALVFFEFAGLLPMQIKKIAPEMRSPTKLHGENSCGACRIQNRRRPATRRSSNFRHLTDAWKGTGRYRIDFPLFGPKYILARRCELVSRCRLYPFQLILSPCAFFFVPVGQAVSSSGSICARVWPR